MREASEKSVARKAMYAVSTAEEHLARAASYREKAALYRSEAEKMVSEAEQFAELHRMRGEEMRGK